MVLLSAQGMDIAQIARVAITSPDRVRDVINNFNDDGFESLYPRYAGGRPRTFTLCQRQAIKKIALSRPVDHDLPFSTWRRLAVLAGLAVPTMAGRWDQQLRRIGYRRHIRDRPIARVSRQPLDRAADAGSGQGGTDGGEHRR
jgi:transposase